MGLNLHNTAGKCAQVRIYDFISLINIYEENTAYNNVPSVIYLVGFKLIFNIAWDSHQ